MNHSFYKLLMRVRSFILLTVLLSEKVNNNILPSIKNEASVLPADKSQEVPNYFVVYVMFGSVYRSFYHDILPVL